MISVDFDDFSSPFTQFLLRLRRYMKHSRQLLHQPSKHQVKWSKIHRCTSYFQFFSRCLDTDQSAPLMHYDPDRSWITDPDPDHPVSGYPDETPSLVIYYMAFILNYAVKIFHLQAHLEKQDKKGFSFISSRRLPKVWITVK